jgi:cytochrome oxidase Cu insertion factor (SCO1/SenC/PrrC family)
METIMGRLRVAIVLAALFGVGFATMLAAGLKPQGAGSGTALIGGPFTLTNTEGKRVSDSDFRGKLMLVFFGYTNCPDICPAELITISQMMEKLGADASKVAPIFISVDPQRDTPEVLAAYIKNFGQGIVGLTGTPDEVASAAKAYRVYYKKSPSESGGPDYSMDHSAFTYLMDAQGKFLTHFTPGASAGAMAATIRKYLSSDKNA